LAGAEEFSHLHASAPGARGRCRVSRLLVVARCLGSLKRWLRKHAIRALFVGLLYPPLEALRCRVPRQIRGIVLSPRKEFQGHQVTGLGHQASSQQCKRQKVKRAQRCRRQARNSPNAQARAQCGRRIGRSHVSGSDFWGKEDSDSLSGDTLCQAKTSCFPGNLESQRRTIVSYPGLTCRRNICICGGCKKQGSCVSRVQSKE